MLLFEVSTWCHTYVTYLRALTDVPCLASSFLEPDNNTPSPPLPGGTRHPVSYALAALTTRAASDPSYDYERLETLGDAVLKYLATLYTYGKER